MAAIFVVAFGVFLPAQMAQPGCPRRDRGLLRWVPPIVVSTWIADSFAGERERHTPNATGEPPLYRAILFGKIGSAVGTLLLNCAHGGSEADGERPPLVWSPAFTSRSTHRGRGGQPAHRVARHGSRVSSRSAPPRCGRRTVTALPWSRIAWVPILAVSPGPTLERAALQFRVGALQSGDLAALRVAAFAVLLVIVVVQLAATSSLSAQAAYSR